jgi:two-component system, cell cycle sensor histidine kinase and response regulator CckA
MTDEGSLGSETEDARAASDRGTLQPDRADSGRSRRDFFAGDPWAAPLVLGLVAGALRLIAPGPPWSSVLILVVGLGAVMPMAYRASLSTGRNRRTWALFVLSVTCAVVTITLYPLDGVAPIGGLRDGFDLGTYMFGGLGALLFARGFGEADPDAWLDAAILGILLSLVVLEFMISPWGTLAIPGLPPYFPLGVAAMDAIVFTTLARFVIRPVASRSLSGLGLLIGLVLVLDATYYGTGTTFIARPVYEAMWMVAYGAWGAGAIHPDIARFTRGEAMPRRGQEDEIRNAFRAVVAYPLAFLAAGILLWLDHEAHSGAHNGVMLVAIVLMSALTVARSARVVRRLARDGRDRTQVETRLRESEERFRRLAEAAPVGIFVADADGKTIYENEALSAITGVKGRAPAEDFSTAVHPDDRVAARRAWAAAVGPGMPASTEQRIVRSDGSIAWVHIRAVPLPGADGATTGWVGTVADVTVLKEAVTAAVEREAFFNGLIEQSPIGIGVYGLDGALIGLNSAKRRVRERIGATLEVRDIRKDPLMLQLGQGDAIARAYAGEAAAADPSTVSAAVAGTHGAAEGERVWLRFRWYPLRDSESRILAVISFAEDITETIEADVRERRVSEKIQETQKLEALGVLAGGIAHDFNNLLVPIIGYVDLALGDVPPDSPLVADLQAARLAASRAADLARQMLAYSGRGSFAIGPVVLEELLGEIGDLMARSIAKAARLRYEFAPGLPPVLADATELRQVALNLIVNASDALGGKHGDITLRTAMTTLEADDPDVIPGANAEPGEYVMLEVSDTGSGMDDATRARIFDPFFSTKSMGRGLGLAATMGIIKGHGGTIRVRSKRGKGSTFQVLLRPHLAIASAVEAEHPALPSRAATGRVLMVDDEPSVRQVGRRILERAGFSVDEADDGPVAIERFRADPNSFDSVLLDLTLPTLDGLAVLRELRAMRPDVPIVLCSGWSADEVADSVRSLPRTVFLQKPYQRQELVDALTKVAEPPMPGPTRRRAASRSGTKRSDD